MGAVRSARSDKGATCKVLVCACSFECADGLMVKVSAGVGRRAVWRGVERGECMQQRLSSGVDRGQGAGGCGAWVVVAASRSVGG